MFHPANSIEITLTVVVSEAAPFNVCAGVRQAWIHCCAHSVCIFVRGQLKCDGTRAETGFSLSSKRTSTFKSAGAPVQSTTGISGSNAG